MTRAAAPARAPLLPFLVLATGVTLVITAAFGLGVTSLPGLAILAAAAVTAGILVLRFRADLLVTLVLTPIPLGAVWIFFPFEMVFVVLGLAVVVREIATRSPWLERLTHLELANLLLVLWASFSLLWSFDAPWFFHGAHRVWLGFLALWIAYRAARHVPRERFELGLVLGAASLASAALLKRWSLGYSTEQAAFRRAAATDLGWGTGNYIATLLLLLAPIVLDRALHAERRSLRVLSWPTLALITLMQGIIASRAAAALFVGGMVVQVIGGHSRKRLIQVIVVLAGLVALLVSPLGLSILTRFTSVRELGSMAVRVWYWRVAWQRTLDHLPWGMGLSQGWAYPDRLTNTDPHNYWLALAYELGIPGVVGWAIVLGILWRAIGRLRADPAWADLGRALQIAFWVGNLHTLVEPTFQGHHYQFVWFWLFGGYLGYFALSRAAARSPLRGVITPLDPASARSSR